MNFLTIYKLNYCPIASQNYILFLKKKFNMYFLKIYFFVFYNKIFIFLGDKIIYFNIFLNKKILKNNNYYIFKHP